MTSTLTRDAHRLARPPRPASVVAGVVVAALASVLVNAVIAVAVASTHPGGTEVGLSAIQYAPLTAAGVLAGTAGWAWIRRSSRRPRAVLRVVVPLVVLMSFLPDALLLLGGTTVINAAGLLVMHLVVAGILVPVLARVLPLPATDPDAHGTSRT